VLAGLLVTAALARSGLGDELSGGKIVIVAPKVEAGEARELARVIGAHMGDLGVRPVVSVVEGNPAELFGRIAAVRDKVDEAGAFAALWVSGERSMLHLYLQRGDRAENLIIQGLPDHEEAWSVVCDTAAAITRSAVISWMETSEAARPSPVTTGSSVEPAPSPDERSKAVAPAKRVFVGSLTYELALPHVGQPPLHGASLSLGGIFLDALQLDLRAGVFGPGRFEADGQEVLFRRIPVSIGGGWVWTWRRWHLGLRLGLLLDVTFLRGEPVEDARDDTSLLGFAVSPSLFARWLFAGPVGAYAEAGADLCFSPRYYTWHSQKVYEYDLAQARVSVGLTVTL